MSAFLFLSVSSVEDSITVNLLSHAGSFLDVCLNEFFNENVQSQAERVLTMKHMYQTRNGI